MKADFSGYATKSGLLCSDGRVIHADAFKQYDGKKIPLVWSHKHNEPAKVLGHGILEHRADGTYVYGFFNNTVDGQTAKELVHHKDIEALSIYANDLVQRGPMVTHGNLIEVSLVMAGANAGAKIDNVYLQHGEDDEPYLSEEIAEIYTGLPLEHSIEMPDRLVLMHSLAEAGSSGSVSIPAQEETPEPGTEPIPAAKPEESEPIPAVNPQDGDTEEVIAHAATTQEKNVADETTKQPGDKTIPEIIDTLTPEQTKAVQWLLGEAANAAPSEEDLQHAYQEGQTMTRNAFDQTASEDKNPGYKKISGDDLKTLMHAASDGNTTFRSVLAQARKGGAQFADVLAHAGDYGINDIDFLFPDAKTVGATPELISRQADWVPKVLEATKHSPFAKVKSITADITADEARAKGYIKGTEKKDEVIELLRRTTGPTTIYKKQRLDRDDILDITDFDVIAWLKWEIRFMLNEEIARAILIGDGRSNVDPDKIKDPAGAIDGTGIRSILKDSDLYAIKKELAANVSIGDTIDGVTYAMIDYRGSGTPTYYTSPRHRTDMILLKDKFGKRIYDTNESLAAALGVKEIVTVPAFEEVDGLLGIIVNLVDYTVGTNRGGELTFFEDFDIDFNQEKYLLETRMSGGLTKPKSAIVITRNEGTSVAPTAPSFNGATNTITIPTKVGVVYKIDDVVKTQGSSVVITTNTELVAEAAEGYYFPSGTTYTWNFNYTAP